MKSLFYGFMNITNKLAAASAKIDENYNSSVSPLYEFLDAWGPFLIGMVTGLCVIYSVVLMVQYVKAEDAGTRDAQKKKVINAIISMVVVIVLLVILYALRDTFVELMNDTN